MKLFIMQVPKKEKTSKVNHGIDSGVGECQLPADIQSSTVSSSVQSTLGNVDPRIFYCVCCLQYSKHSIAMGTGSIHN